MTTSDDFIEQFIEHYAAHDAAYKALTRKLESECRELCSQEGIKAVVSSRTKDKERLSDKIRKRASKKANGYGSLEEIKLDIVDLCGARISLYYPADRRRVSDLVKEKFKSYAGKTHPEEDMPEAEGGDYHGINHRASREDPALGWVRIEIQIMTLLMNAWLEISHDDLYHGREGPLSPEEKALLKQINRLVLEAEENAERYQNLAGQRPRNVGRPFRSTYDVLDFLGETFLRENAYSKWFYNTQRKDLLFWLIRSSGYDTPATLKPLVSHSSSEEDPRRALMERIFAQKPELILPYMLQKSPHLVGSDEERKPMERAVEYWRLLDRVLRFLAARNGNTGKPFVGVDGHIGLTNLAQEEAQVIRSAWKNIDGLVNAIARILPGIIDGWNERLLADMQKLASSTDPVVVSAFEWARSAETGNLPLQLPPQ